MNDIKKRSTCEMNSSKYNFYKDISSKFGLNPICKICWRCCYIENYEKIGEHRQEYNKQNRAKINKFEKTGET